MKHELKIWPQYYEPVAKGLKTFEIRENDRGFQNGDEVVLREWNPNIVDKEYQEIGVSYKEPIGYTSSKPLIFKIGYVLPIDEKRVVFSLLPIDEADK